MQKIKLRDIRAAMMIINIIAVLFVALVIHITTENICMSYSAREFLDTVSALPQKPWANVVFTLFLCVLLVISFVLREIVYADDIKIVYALFTFELLVSIMIIVTLHFNYNGLFFWVFAGILIYAKGNKGKYLLISMALISFLLTDSQLLSLTHELYSINDYISYYDASLQKILLGSYNMLTSINIIMFISYCIQMIQQQKGTIEEVNMLYEEIRKTNADLENANNQLAEYAKITEHMGETKERNRLAREIHDTLGHTLTGISVGIDACIATVELAPTETKAHLERISDVARNGLLDIRRSVNELKPDALERLSLETAITKMITDMKSITDMQIFFDCKVKTLKFDEDEESAIYRVIQESLTNAMRHGKASRAWITIDRHEGDVILTIRDNGIGCAEIKSGFGTKHIMERIKMLDGTVTFDSENGFSVTAKIPIRWGETYD